MKVLIVDDEPLARQRAIRLMQTLDDIEIVGEAANAEQAIVEIDRLEPDALLLDIAMPGMSGIELAQRLAERESSPAIVFCTAYDEYAIAAFDAQAVGYLLKPIQRDKLTAVFGRLSRLNAAQIAALTALAPAAQRTQLASNGPQGVSLLPIAVVRYFHADNKYVSAVHPGGALLIDDSLRDLEEEFSGQFIRVHRNALVALKYIQGIERQGVNSYRVLLQDIEQGPKISRRYLPAIRARLANGI
ncbi:Transcriptional regulatory protein BtsR [Zhongshania aliphaticivorans]|uniref:Transcriptional regulatory protein BtsR n=1 Tax=Zhongshania aliphaticivorans TaxID=1470434 RepID=A0A5S9QAW7_9GAMM|nr:LytTR family DNA-binding domain-containing protein [Zhongshania aliphaticivorans]CAA0102384.1 Transcriptional regulatory protein BtsR [Zhongshania aliphaticivorans]CAA0114341.1 Transcriptional regulatory protein BtsR [Zhongshania aliphaticivorans]